MNEINKESIVYYKACDNLSENKDLELFLNIQYENLISQFIATNRLFTELEANVIKEKLAFIKNMQIVIKKCSKKYLDYINNKN